MDIKERLEKFKYVAQKVDSLSDEINYLAGIKGKVDNAITVSGGEVKSTVESAAVKIENLTKQLTRKADELQQVMNDVMELINDEVLTDNERLVLQYRYINCYSWNAINKLMHYEERQPFNIHSSAIHKLREKYLV